MRSALILFCLISTLALADTSGVIRLSDPVMVTETHEVFGAAMPTGVESMSLAAVVEQSQALSGQAVRIEAEIVQVCQKKGCFFIARDGDAVARVRFKDYGFFIPTDAAGKTVQLAGRIEKVELSPEQAAHFAEDLGQPAPATQAPVFEYQIMATSVQIPLG